MENKEDLLKLEIEKLKLENENLKLSKRHRINEKDYVKVSSHSEESPIIDWLVDIIKILGYFVLIGIVAHIGIFVFVKILSYIFP